MPSARVENRSRLLAAAVSLTLAAGAVSAQEKTEEIVVTGSYIKRDTFDAPSPTEVIDSAVIQESGAPAMGNFIRDLTFTANTDVVSNVLGTQDGQQDSNSANFNIRGLGVGSTLTLFDGRRVVSGGAVGSLVPELAMQRFEVVLDGGAALYGTDAVAGVVNIIPVKRYNGIKSRVFYNQADDNAFHQPKYSLMAGHTFFDSLDIVVAADYSKKSALYRVERPEYLRIDNDSSTSANPGVYTRIGPTGIVGAAYRDPACGTFNQGNTDGGLQGSFPSGTISGATGCLFEYGQFHDYARPAEEYNTYLSAVYAINDKVNVEFQANGDWRTSFLITSPTTSLQGNNLLLRVPVANPGNQSGSILRPQSWRPITGYGTRPTILGHRGEGTADYNYTTDRMKLGLTYDFGDSSWSGETWVSSQTGRTEIDGFAPRMSRLQAALNGLGGPNCAGATPGANGCEWWNPFGSSDPRSPDYTAARANSQQLVDWMFTEDKVESVRERLQFVESIVTGEVVDLPAGPLAMALGGQVRELRRWERTGPAALAQDDYNVYIGDEPDGTVFTESQVRALFAEVNVPILESLSLQVAVRHEDFVDLNLDATKPKVAVRWAPLDTLAFRASYGEGFLAPTPNDILVETSPGCGEIFTGNDPFRGVSIAGGSSCLNGNPNLVPEDSTIYNIGFTWEIIDNLEFSADFQTIEYVDRISTLTALDVLNRDFSDFLAAGGYASTADYNARTTAIERAALATAWFASGNQDPNITREADGRFFSVLRTPENLSSNEVDVVDMKVKYSFDLGDTGSYSTQLSSTYYSRYEYTDFRGNTVDAVGLQNGQTGLAPPLPDWKHSFRAAWGLGGHGAAVAVKHQAGVKFDSSVPTGVTPPDRISSYTTVDVRYGYKFENFFGGELDFALGSSNVLDAKPDRLPVVGGLETRLGDPFGRQLYVEANIAFGN